MDTASLFWSSDAGPEYLWHWERTYTSRARNYRLEITRVSRCTENNTSVDKFSLIGPLVQIIYRTLFIVWIVRSFVLKS